MNRTKERGVALILALILLLVLSVMALSLMFLSQTETWSSLNYRLMSQARDGAEAGVNAAANFLMYGYTPPGGAGDALSNYTMTASPVTYSNSPVILSANSNMSSNYPVSSVQNSFNTAGQGGLTAGYTTVNYGAYATLLSMQQVSVYGSTTPATIQTWQITSDGSINGIRNAHAEVSAILERAITPVFTYAVFATSNGCSALTFGGGGTTDSYDSGTVVGGVASTQAYGGNVGTNGNLSTSGNPTTINGSLSTPRAGVGTCTANNVTAWTDNQGKVTGGLIELPQPISYPPPDPPSPAPPTTNVNVNNGNCSGTPGCVGDKGTYTFAPGSYGNVSLNGGATLHLTAGTYNINSLTEAGQGTIVVDSGPVILNVAGTSVSGAVVDLTGGGVTNASLVPMNFQILYAGSGTVKLKGGGQASGLMYAPNATFSFGGGGSWYGAIIGQTMADMGGAAIHYDRRLQNTAFSIGNFMLTSFTWKKY